MVVEAMTAQTATRNKILLLPNIVCSKSLELSDNMPLWYPNIIRLGGALNHCARIPTSVCHGHPLELREILAAARFIVCRVAYDDVLPRTKGAKDRGASDVMAVVFVKVSGPASEGAAAAAVSKGESGDVGVEAMLFITSASEILAWLTMAMADVVALF